MKYLFGKLTDRDIVGLLRWVYIRRRTGVLEVGEAAARKRLNFISGELYIARSHPLAERLDQYLQFDQARPAKLAVAAPRPAASPAQPLPEDLHELVGRIAEHLCAWQVESFRFIEGPPSAEAEVVGPLPTALLLMTAAANHFEESKLIARLGGSESFVVARPAAADDPAVAELGPDDAFLYFQLQTPQPLSRYLEATESDRRRWLSALCRLWAVDLVTPSSLRQAEPARSGRQPTRPAVERIHPRTPTPSPTPVRPIPHSEPWPAAKTVAPEQGDPVAALWRDHFRLRGEPFSLTPDPAFLFLSEGHAEVLAGLKLGLLEHRGLIVVTGEVGTGKTTLLYSLLSEIGPEVETAYVANTALTFEEILESALQDFGVPAPGPRRLDLLEALNRFLLASAQLGHIVALVIDEAQNLSDESFEQIRLLLNFESHTRKLLQIVLVGQPELGAKLRSNRLRQIADRVAVRCNLGPLDRRDALRYVDHRLEAVGGSSEVFTRRALALVARKSRGVPRRINILCHNAMLFAYGRDLRRVDRSQVAEAAREMALGRRAWMAALLPWRRSPVAEDPTRGFAARGGARPLVAALLAGLAAALLALAVSALGAERQTALRPPPGTDSAPFTELAAPTVGLAPAPSAATHGEGPQE